MLKLYETKKIEIETKLNNVASTYEGFTKYQKKHPNDELSLIIGADNLLQFEKWINYQYLLDNYQFIIIKRDELGKKYIKNRMKEFHKTDYIILDLPIFNVSSTFIRDNINNPKELKNKIDPRIYKYIKENCKL